MLVLIRIPSKKTWLLETTVLCLGNLVVKIYFVSESAEQKKRIQVSSVFKQSFQALQTKLSSHVPDEDLVSLQGPLMGAVFLICLVMRTGTVTWLVFLTPSVNQLDIQDRAQRIFSTLFQNRWIWEACLEVAHLQHIKLWFLTPHKTYLFINRNICLESTHTIILSKFKYNPLLPLQIIL